MRTENLEKLKNRALFLKAEIRENSFASKTTRTNFSGIPLEKVHTSTCRGQNLFKK